MYRVSSALVADEWLVTQGTDMQKSTFDVLSDGVHLPISDCKLFPNCECSLKAQLMAVSRRAVTTFRDTRPHLGSTSGEFISSPIFSSFLSEFVVKPSVPRVPP